MASDLKELALKEFARRELSKRSAETPGSSIISQLGSGTSEGVANMLGLPVDAINSALNFFGAGSKNPVLGSGNIKDILSPFIGSGPLTSEQRISRRIGQEVGAGAIPGLGFASKAVSPAKFIAGEAGLSALGGGAAGATKESGGGELAQLAAQIATPLGAIGIASGIPSVARKALTGGETGRLKALKNAETFNKAGAEPSLSQVLSGTPGGFPSQALTTGVGKVPGGQGIIQRFSEKQASDLGSKASKIANKISKKQDIEIAGLAIKKGIVGEGGVIDRFKNRGSELYDKVDKFIPQETLTDVSRTRKALEEITAPIKGAEELSRMFISKKSIQIKSALEKDVYNSVISQTKNIDGLQEVEKVDVLRTIINNKIKVLLGGESVSPISVSAKSKASTDFDISNNPKLNAIIDGVINKKLKGENIGKLQEAFTREDLLSTEGIPYEAVKKLRTVVGNILSDGDIIDDLPRSQIKKMYAALSSDLENAAEKAGPDAVKAAKKANGFWRSGMERIDNVFRRIATKKEPEQIFLAIESGDKRFSTVRTVMRGLKPGERDVVASTMLKRMGQATAGQADSFGEGFSSARFLTNWNKIGPKSRRLIFSSKNARQYSKDLQALADAGDIVKKGARVIANPSGTASQSVNIGAGVAAVGGAALSPMIPAYIILGGMAANRAAKILTSKKAIRFITSKSKLSQEKFTPLAIRFTQKLTDPELQKAMNEYISNSKTSYAPSNQPGII